MILIVKCEEIHKKKEKKNTIFIMNNFRIIIIQSLCNLRRSAAGAPENFSTT